MFKGLGNIASLLKQAQEMGGRVKAINEDLKTKKTIGRSGGGMIEVEVNGLGQLLRVTIDQSLIEQKDKEMIEDLLPAAFNQAQAKAKEMHADAMKQLTGGIELPGNLSEMLSQATDDLGGNER